MNAPLPMNRGMVKASLLIMALTFYPLLVGKGHVEEYLFMAIFYLMACWGYRRAWSFEGRYDQWRRTQVVLAQPVTGTHECGCPKWKEDYPCGIHVPKLYVPMGIRALTQAEINIAQARAQFMARVARPSLLSFIARSLRP